MREYLYRLATDKEKGFAAAFFGAFLMLLSYFYALAVWAILLLYRIKIFKTHTLPVPVISVGNITLGGVGKTPMVQFIARYLKEKGIKPVILTRGYMGEGVKAESDEAALLSESLGGIPVVVGANRVKMARKVLKKYSPDVFILDDGFQHWRLARNLDIVLVDAARPFGNGWLLPRGILREPRSSLRRAGMIVLTKTDLAEKNLAALEEKIKDFNSLCPVIETVHRPVSLKDFAQNKAVELSFLKGKTVAALSSIGDPVSFEKLLKSCGAAVKKHFAFPDHHVFTEKDLALAADFCKEERIDVFIVTEKDAVKLKALLPRSSGVKFLSLPIKIEITEGEDEFFKRISDCVHS